MAIYHKYYRLKNPARRSAVRGGRKTIVDSIYGLPVRAKRRDNPPGGAIDLFNVLGYLNQGIEAGSTDLIPLRDVVQAKIEGYLDGDSFKLSLIEATRDLGAKELKAVKGLLLSSRSGSDDGFISVSQRASIDDSVSRDPDVRKSRSSLEKIKSGHRRIRSRIAASSGSDIEYIVGKGFLDDMKAANKAARDELGSGGYHPADESLWKRAMTAVKKRYPDGYIRPRIKSISDKDDRMRAILADKSISKNDRRIAEEAVSRINSTRLRNTIIVAYEKAGGKELSQREYNRLRAIKEHPLGVSRPIGDNLSGKISKHPTGDGFIWELMSSGGSVFMSGKSGSKGSATKSLSISKRILMNLYELGSGSGWDNLDSVDRRWLTDHKPNLSRGVASALLKNMEGRHPGDREIGEWIVRFLKIKKTGGKMASKNKTLKSGESATITGDGGKHLIHAHRNRAGVYIYHVEVPGIGDSAVRRAKSYSEMIRRSALISGSMSGASDVAAAVGNPAKIKKLKSASAKYFRKNNPAGKRRPVNIGDIQDLIGTTGLPKDPQEAARYGYYAGIIAGMDTCGVQNYWKRAKIRKEYYDRMVDAHTASVESFTGISRRNVKSKDHVNKKSSYDIFEMFEEE